MTWSGRVLMLAVVVLSMFGCKPTLNGPCDAAQLDSLRKATPGMPAEDRAVITTVGLGEACGASLPSNIADVLKVLPQARQADRATIIVGVLGENLSFARGACPEWRDVVQALGPVPPADKVRLLYAGCHYERLGLFTEAELTTSWKAGGLALLAAPVYAWLVDKRMEPAEAKRLARQMFLGEVPEPAKAPAP